MDALSEALGEDGIFLAQVGETDEVGDSGEVWDTEDQMMSFRTGLKQAGFEDIIEYQESHGRFFGPWSFLVAMKNKNTRSRWFSNEAQFNARIVERGVSTRNGESPFRFFDGATMMGYQQPPRVDEVTWCREVPKPHGCNEQHGFDPAKQNVPVSMLQSMMGRDGVAATVDVKEGSYIGLEECVHGLHIPPAVDKNLQLLNSKFPLQQLRLFQRNLLDGYGRSDFFWVS